MKQLFSELTQRITILIAVTIILGVLVHVVFFALGLFLIIFGETLFGIMDKWPDRAGAR